MRILVLLGTLFYFSALWAMLTAFEQVKPYYIFKPLGQTSHHIAIQLQEINVRTTDWSEQAFNVFTDPVRASRRAEREDANIPSSLQLPTSFAQAFQAANNNLSSIDSNIQMMTVLILYHLAQVHSVDTNGPLTVTTSWRGNIAVTLGASESMRLILTNSNRSWFRSSLIRRVTIQLRASD